MRVVTMDGQPPFKAEPPRLLLPADVALRLSFWFQRRFSSTGEGSSSS